MASEKKREDNAHAAFAASFKSDAEAQLGGGQQRARHDSEIAKLSKRFHRLARSMHMWSR
jgi:hypothetical protein